MADRKPLKVLPDSASGTGGGDSTGIGEFVAGDTLGVVDGGTGLAAVGANQLLTGHNSSTTGALTSESNLTFTGSHLGVSGTIGVGSAVADATQGVGIHICTADADPDATVNASNDELILEGNTSVGMSLLTDSDGVARITWGHGSGTDAYSGQIGYYQGSDYMNFLTASTERMRIDSTGKVGIGTAAPDGTLHVHTATAGSVTAHANADDLVVEGGTGNEGITVLGTDAGAQYYYFGSPTDPDYGQFMGQYNSGSPYIATRFSGVERMRISSTGNASIGVAADGLARLRIKHDQSQQVLWPTQTDASRVTQVMQVGSVRAAGTHNLLILYSSEAGSADAEFRFQGDGNAYADGSWNASGADYQEWFESLDGTEYEIGKAVVLDGDKVRIFDAATDSADNILGITRPQADNKNSAVVGNTAWNHWTDKYLTDDWGVYIREDVSLWTWTDEENNYGVYERDMLRRNPDWTPPEGAVESVQSVRKLNPDYVAPNPDNAEGEPEDEGYSPRADRAEWNLIGLLGQVQIKANEPTNPRWIKMKNISDAVELWMIR